MVKRVDDHSFWAGRGGKESPMPMDSKMKFMDEGEGAGELGRYEDTEQEVERAQDMARRKVESHPQRANYRN